MAQTRMLLYYENKNLVDIESYILFQGITSADSHLSVHLGAAREVTVPNMVTMAAR